MLQVLGVEKNVERAPNNCMTYQYDVLDALVARRLIFELSQVWKTEALQSPKWSQATYKASRARLDRVEGPAMLPASSEPVTYCQSQ